MHIVRLYWSLFLWRKGQQDKYESRRTTVSLQYRLWSPPGILFSARKENTNPTVRENERRSSQFRSHRGQK